VLSVSNLRAYYQTKYFGVSREVRAVDGVSLHIDRNEIYGLAGESSCGKTTLIKTIVRAIRAPLNVVDGSVRFTFADASATSMRWTTRSSPPSAGGTFPTSCKGSMNVLNPVRPGAPILRRFRRASHRQADAAIPAAGGRPSGAAAARAAILDSYPHELSGGMRQRVTIALASVCRPDFIVADEPTTALDVVVQKDVLGLLREVQREIGSSMILVTHDIGVHANVTDRLGIMYAGPAGGGGAHRRGDPQSAPPLHGASRVQPAAHRAIRRRRRDWKARRPNLAAPPSGCRFHPRCPLAMEICRSEHPPMVDTSTSILGHRVACWATGGLRRRRWPS
jgi:peptide/nickel transport system ATP-binding protein